MKITTLALAIAGLVTAAGANADAGEDLLKKSGCTACHAIDKKVVGPAYIEFWKFRKEQMSKLINSAQDQVKKANTTPTEPGEAAPAAPAEGPGPAP